MEAGPPSSSTIAPGSGPQTSRKERGAIAAQVSDIDFSLTVVPVHPLPLPSPSPFGNADLLPETPLIVVLRHHPLDVTDSTITMDTASF